MGKDVLTQHLMARGNKGGHECVVLFDSGASHSFARRMMVEQIASIVPLPTPVIFTLADGSQLTVSESVTLSLDVGGTRVTDVFMVHPQGSLETGVDDLILGASTMRKFGLKLDFEHAAILCTLNDKPAPVQRARQRKEWYMNEMLKRILARMGMTNIPDALTDEDAINMICDRAKGGMGYMSVAMQALSLDEKATEADVIKAIDNLKAEAVTQEEPTARAFIAKVLPALNLPVSDDMTEDKAQALIVAAVKKTAPATAVASDDILMELSLPNTATEEKVIGAIRALKDPGNVITVQQHHDLEQKHRAYRLNTVIHDAISNGKAFPFEETTLRREVEEDNERGKDGLARLEAKLEARPKLMPIGERLQPAVKTDEMDVATSSIAKQMGVSAETLRKYAA